MDNNLTISSEDFKGTDIHKGLYSESFAKSSDIIKSKDDSDEFSDKPQKKESEDKKDSEPKTPSVEESHESEMKAKALRAEESAKMDKKCTYQKMSKIEKRALKVLLNIKGKSAKDKIDSVMEHFGVSKMGAMTILADASKDMSDDSEKSKGKDAKDS